MTAALTNMLVFALWAVTITPQQDSLTTPSSIQAAEREGQTYRQADPQPRSPFLRVDELIGSTERKCVEIPAGTRPAWPGSYRKSGEFAVGGETGVMSAGQEAKIPWMPFHDPLSIHATLVVRGSRLDEPGITSRFVSTNYALPSGSHDYAFYATGFSLPNAGRWLLVATSGNDWGCFIFTVQQPED